MKQLYGLFGIMVLFTALLTTVGARAAEPGGVFLEDLTTAEVVTAIRGGTTTIIIPVGGTEQSGPHLTLGKHNLRVRVLAGRIAGQLGHTMVAPVVAYVPEGGIDPPTEHMRFAGTISIPEPVFQAMLESAVRSLWAHGFRDVVLVGDHGGYQNALKSVAARLKPPAAKQGFKVHFVDAYYRATQGPFTQALKTRGLTDAQIGVHAGSADTALQMAVAPDSVRPGQFEQAASDGRAGGTNGDPRPATAALGQLGADLVVQQSVAAIRAVVSSFR
jgi:creatinine amidohydrolase